jgi:hypothetical protein
MKKVHLLINANNTVIITKIMIFLQKKKKKKYYLVDPLKLFYYKIEYSVSKEGSFFYV